MPDDLAATPTLLLAEILDTAPPETVATIQRDRTDLADRQPSSDAPGDGDGVTTPLADLPGY